MSSILRAQRIFILVASLLAAVTSLPAQNSPISNNLGGGKKAAVRVLAKSRRTVTLKHDGVQVELDPANAAKHWLADQMGGLQGRSRIYLVLRDLSTEKAPGVLYQIRLNLPPDQKNDPPENLAVGTINFYASQSRSRQSDFFFSFDVTDLMKSLAGRNLLSDRLTITITPEETPLGASEPTIGQIQLILQ